MTETKIIKTKSIIILTIIRLIFILGIISAVLGISNIENYETPYLFGFICGSFGLILTFITAERLKLYLAVNQINLSNYWSEIGLLSGGLIGIFILLGSALNREISYVDNERLGIVSDKAVEKVGRIEYDKNYLIVVINGKTLKLHSSYRYWENTSIGDSVNVTAYKSRLGFDYIELGDDENKLTCC